MEGRTDQLRTLAKLIHDMRPDWHTNGIIQVLAMDSRPVDELRLVAIAAARDMRARGPGVIATRDETEPTVTVDGRTMAMPTPPSIRDVLGGAPIQDEAVAIAGAKRVREAVEAANAECVENRAAVLAYPDLAHRLTLPPLRYARPEQWNGYVPTGHDSRRRLALEVLVDAARRRMESDRW